MALRYFTLELSKTIKLPQNYMYFNWIVHHIQEIYLKLFPKNIDLNKSTKIGIRFGTVDDEPVWDGVLGVTSYYVEDFDVYKFYGLNKNEQENTILEIINNVIINIYKKTGENKEILQEIINVANKIKEIKFNMEINVKKLEKITLDKKYKINICRILNKDVGEGWKYKKIERKTKIVEEEHWINEIPDYRDLTDYYKKSEINGEGYILYDYLGRMVYKITEEEYLQYNYLGKIIKKIKK